MNKKNGFRKWKNKIVVGVVFISIWTLASTLYNPIILPSPLRVAEAFFGLLTSDEFLADLLVTLFRGLGGYFIGIALGTVLGVLMGKSEVIYEYLHSTVVTLQTIPRISWILLAMIWFPLDSSIVIFIIVITVLPIFTLNVYEGMKTVPKELLEMGDIFKVGKNQILKDIYIPSITPFIISGSKVASGITWKSIIMAELLTVNTGIGASMGYSRSALATDQIIAYTVIIVLISFIHQGFIELIYKRTRYSKSNS